MLGQRASSPNNSRGGTYPAGLLLLISGLPAEPREVGLSWNREGLYSSPVFTCTGSTEMSQSDSRSGGDTRAQRLYCTKCLGAQRRGPVSLDWGTAGASKDQSGCKKGINSRGGGGAAVLAQERRAKVWEVQEGRKGSETVTWATHSPPVFLYLQPQFRRAGSFPEGAGHVFGCSERGRFGSSGRSCQEVTPSRTLQGFEGSSWEVGHWEGWLLLPWT